jgi:hypothetical protein
MSAKYCVIKEVWRQTSSDYDSVMQTKAFDVLPTTTVAEIMEWSQGITGLGEGDLKLVKMDTPKTPEHEVKK